MGVISTRLAWFATRMNKLGMFLAVLAIFVAILLQMLPDVEPNTVKATVKHVTCDKAMCDYAVTYIDDSDNGTEKEYVFHAMGSEHAVRDIIDLFEIDGQITHNDPNAWKAATGLMACSYGISTLTITLIWLGLCSVSEILCAANGVFHIIGLGITIFCLTLLLVSRIID